MDKKRLAEISKALGEPRRLELLMAIASAGQLTCGQLAERFPISQPTVSHHLKVLEQAGLISVRREGQHSVFSLRGETFEEYQRLLAELVGKDDRAGVAGDTKEVRNERQD